MKYELYFPSYNVRLNLDTETPLSTGEEICFDTTNVFEKDVLIKSHHDALQLVGKTFRVLSIRRIVRTIDNSRIDSDKNKVLVVLT